MNRDEISEHLDRIESDGYTLVINAIEPELIDNMAADIDRLETELEITTATNRFEGAATKRVYNLLAHNGPWVDVPVHPAVIPIVRGVLGAGCLVSSLSSISIGPGEVDQPIHSDDQVLPIAKPHVATVCNSMWALTDFTEANGATRIIPGSHKRDHDPVYGDHYDSIPAEMPKGSVLIWHGSLWHGGGPNTTTERRVGVAMNYCAGWVRQQENQQLGILPETVAGFSPQLRDLCGFGIYNGIIGHIDKRSPADRMFGDDPSTNLWETDQL